MKRIRVLIADDHEVVQEALRLLIEDEDDMEVVATARDGVEAVLRARATQPDVILMDLAMPRKDGLAALGEIRQQTPLASVLVVSGYSEEAQVSRALRLGAKGYLPKLCRADELFRAIRYVHGGEIFLHPTATRYLVNQVKGGTAPAPTHQALTKREMDVLQLVAQGLSNNDVAEQLYVSSRTVRTHMSNLLAKLHLSNRTQATLYALEQGIVELEQATPPAAP